MPSGRTHDRITFGLFPLIFGSSYWLTQSWILTAWCAGGFLFSGLMFGPDLDIYSVQYKRWGWLRWLWLPYQKFVPHRSVFSHGFLVGTVIRIIYLLTVGFFLISSSVAIAQLIWGFDWNWQRLVFMELQDIRGQNLWSLIVLLCGLELGAMSHYLSDFISSRRVKKRKKLHNRLRKLRRH